MSPATRLRSIPGVRRLLISLGSLFHDAETDDAICDLPRLTAAR